jgi:hypothetical protein
MSDLTATEKRKLERLLGMGSGYVLNFSNPTFEEFVLDSTGRSIYDSKYEYGSGSKANRLRGFWNEESNGVVGKLLGALIEYGTSEGLLNDAGIAADGRRIVSRLRLRIATAPGEGPILHATSLPAGPLRRVARKPEMRLCDSRPSPAVRTQSRPLCSRCSTANRARPSRPS